MSDNRGHCNLKSVQKFIWQCVWKRKGILWKRDESRGELLRESRSFRRSTQWSWIHFRKGKGVPSETQVHILRRPRFCVGSRVLCYMTPFVSYTFFFPEILRVQVVHISLVLFYQRPSIYLLGFRYIIYRGLLHVFNILVLRFLDVSQCPSSLFTSFLQVSKVCVCVRVRVRQERRYFHSTIVTPLMSLFCYSVS